MYECRFLKNKARGRPWQHAGVKLTAGVKALCSCHTRGVTDHSFCGDLGFGKVVLISVPVAKVCLPQLSLLKIHWFIRQ